MNHIKSKFTYINPFTFLLLSLFIIVSGCDSDSNIVSPGQELSAIEMSQAAPSANLRTLPDPAYVATAYVCAQPATATASATFGSINVNSAIDCDLDTTWNSGGWDEASYTITFDTPRVFSGLHITSRATPEETQTYKIVGYKADGTNVTITDEIAIEDPSDPTGGNASKVFDLGEGFVEYTSVSITILGRTSSWKAIKEVELIISKEQCKAGGWEALGFENQGQCVRFVDAGKDSR
jgi:hypothetical protein